MYGANERFFPQNDPHKSFAHVWKKYPRIVEAPGVKHRPQGTIGDIAYLRNKVGLTVPTVRQVLASHNLTLQRGTSVKPIYCRPTPTIRTRSTSSEKRSNPPTIAQDMASWLERSAKRRLTTAILSKRQIMAEVRRNTLLLEKINAFRRNSQNKKTRRGNDARSHFNQDGDMLLKFKEELAQDKKKNLAALHRRQEIYRKIYLGAKNEPRGTCSLTTNVSSVDI